jgi:molybdate transport system permease protein
MLPALAGLVFLVLPVWGLLLRAPWSTLGARLTEPPVLQALRLSLVTATTATALCVLFGVPLAWLLARVAFPGRRLARALITVPLVLPPVVGGVALLMVLGRRGPVGHWLDAAFGITLPFTTAGVVVAETFVAMPFLIVTAEGDAPTRIEYYQTRDGTISLCDDIRVEALLGRDLPPSFPAFACPQEAT